MKAVTTIRIEKELLEKAQQIGLNLSKTVETLLDYYLKGIEQTLTKIQNQNQTLPIKEGIGNVVSDKGWWGSWDLNPGSPAPQAGILDQARRLPQLFGLRLRVYLRFENG